VNPDIAVEVVLSPLAVETAACLVGFSPLTIRAFMRRGDLVPRHLGGKPIFLVAELQASLYALPSEPRRSWGAALPKLLRKF